MEVVYEISVKMGCEVDLLFYKDSISRLVVSVQCQLTYNILVKMGGQERYILYRQSRGDG